jgi:hypothetical protein
MRWSTISLAFLMSLGVPAAAAAGPVERLAQVMVHPHSPNTIVLRYDNGGGGLVVSRDGGASFQLLCSSATNVAGERINAAALSGDGQILLGTFSGMSRDDGKGCAFTREPVLDGRWVPDVTADPIDAQIMYAVTALADPADNGVYRSVAGGAFVPIGSTARRLITRLRVVALPDGGRRFYASAVDGAVQPPLEDGGIAPARYMLRVSDDEGQTWIERPIALADGSMRLAAVDPTAPDRVVIVVNRVDEPDSVMLSEDAGASFHEYARAAEVSGMVVTGGGRVFIADAGEPLVTDIAPGLWSAPSLAEPPALNAAAGSLLCLGEGGGDKLLACQPFMFGALDPESGALDPLLDFRAVQEMVQCDGIDMVATCEAQLRPAYCDISHFACAPVCAAYPQTDPVLIDAVAESCGDRAVQAPAVEPGQQADAGAPVAGSPGNANAAGAAAPDAGSMQPDVPPPARNCSTAGALSGDAAPALPGVLGLAFAALVLRRRRARHSSVQRSPAGSTPASGE